MVSIRVPDRHGPKWPAAVEVCTTFDQTDSATAKPGGVAAILDQGATGSWKLRSQGEGNMEFNHGFLVKQPTMLRAKSRQFRTEVEHAAACDNGVEPGVSHCIC